ncbi:MAG: phosphate ABC transporter substrate-binding protein [Dehalococcoidia bacterium]
MKRNLLMVLALVLLISLVPVLTGCSSDDDDTNGNGGGNGDSGGVELSGNISEAGSTSVQPLAEKMAAEFMGIHPKVRVTVSGGGSSAGVQSCAKGMADIGAASRDVKITEPDLIPIAIARDAVAIAVHPSNPVSELSLEQVKKIYEGDITNWSEVGGNDAGIVVISREEGSGTRDCFESKVTKEIKLDALFFDSNGAVKTKVESEPDAIGFLSLGYVGNLKAVTLDGVDPSMENCRNGKYPILRRLYLLTRDVPDGAVKEFIDFCRSDEGQQIAETEGYIPLVK